MKIRFYGKLADLLGSEVDVEIGGPCSVEEVKRLLSATSPAAAEALGNARVRACVGDSIVTDRHCLAPADQLEFLAPVSGG